MKINKHIICSTAPDWQSALSIVSSNAIHSAPSFDLYISRREGREYIVHLELQSDNNNKIAHDNFKTPIRITAALYDLYW